MRLHGGVAPILLTEAVPGRPGFGGYRLVICFLLKKGGLVIQFVSFLGWLSDPFKGLSDLKTRG